MHFLVYRQKQGLEFEKLIYLSVTSGGYPLSFFQCKKKTVRQDITEILLKVALNTINQTNSIQNLSLISTESIAKNI